jgi:hypothetical protein
VSQVGHCLSTRSGCSACCQEADCRACPSFVRSDDTQDPP